MSLLREISGVDVSEFQVIALTQAAFSETDFGLYPPLRTHFLIHAIQFQHGIPSEQSMLRSQRRNERKAGKDKANKIVGRPILGIRMPTRSFVVPSKHGPQPPKRIRRRAPRNINMAMLRPMPPNMMRIGMPMGPMGPMPGTTGPLGHLGPMPIGIIGGPMGLGFPSLSGLPGAIPGGLMPMPMLPSPPSFVRPPSFSMAAPFGLSMPLMASTSSVPSVLKKIKGKKGSKQVNTAFKVRSPEQIVLKCARTACKEEVEKWRKNIQPNISEVAKEEIPIYFKKKKANQKRRRLEKHELIKKHRKKLVEIYGIAIFRTGWPISRQEIKEALGIKEDEEEENKIFENIGELMSEQQVTREINKGEQIVKSQQNTSINENEAKSEKKEKEFELILLKKSDVDCQLLQFVYTN